MGLLERAHSYKDKLARGICAERLGLFFYPVLMAADILIYRSNLVPVGQDQVQHIEMTRDMAGSFNQTFTARCFRCPAHRLDRAPTVPGTDGKKMSKSYGNTIEIFAEGKALKYAVMRIVTDSTPVEAPKDPVEGQRLRALRALRRPRWREKALAARYRAGRPRLRGRQEDAAREDRGAFRGGARKTQAPRRRPGRGRGRPETGRGAGACGRPRDPARGPGGYGLR